MFSSLSTKKDYIPMQLDFILKYLFVYCFGRITNVVVYGIGGKQGPYQSCPSVLVGGFPVLPRGGWMGQTNMGTFTQETAVRVQCESKGQR